VKSSKYHKKKDNHPKIPTNITSLAVNKFHKNLSLLINHHISYAFKSWYKNNTSLLSFDIFNSR